jgi:hypothetical protein
MTQWRKFFQQRLFLKMFARLRRQKRKLWLSNSGDWHWLHSKPATVASLNRLLWRESVPSFSFFVMLTLSGVISTLGLLLGSTATVIGAMIIAPLMGPIIGIAYAIAISNRRLMKRAAVTLLWGTLATVLCSGNWAAGLDRRNPLADRADPPRPDGGDGGGGGGGGGGLCQIAQAHRRCVSGGGDRRGVGAAVERDWYWPCPARPVGFLGR